VTIIYKYLALLSLTKEDGSIFRLLPSLPSSSSQFFTMGRDLRLELQKSLSIARYYNSFLFYRYQFDNSDLLEMSWTANFGTRRRITRLISTRIKDLYEKEMDCYTIRWYEKVTEDDTTYAIEVMVRLLESVKIPISNNVSVMMFIQLYMC
jgi:hypothetical protein